ncbi:hypothetical protein [uncultured Dubosiella sp.]|uniref:hypothetical protein n=1 Tax=uncultured Dubosiella sp. TaxID=1937011 RepID=UPI002596608B|nr:hypothetical protein [uncultured Dubosiella sp.]
MKKVDFEFMNRINTGIEQRAMDRWIALNEKAEAEATKEVRVAFVVVTIVMLLISFALETPH